MVGPGTKLGILIAGQLRVVRVANVEPCGQYVRITKNTKCIVLGGSNQTAVEPATREIHEQPFAGLEEELNRIKELMKSLFEHDIDSKQIKPPRGALLYGPPGTGKTLLAHHAIKAVGAICITIDGANGDDDVAVRTITDSFKTKRSIDARAVLFIDEIDTLCENSRSALSALLVGTDNANSRTFLLACTNRPEALNAALRRPGRFDEEFEIPPPDGPKRTLILQAHLCAFPNDVSRDDVLRLAQKAHGFVGADLKLVCAESAFLASERNAKVVSAQDLTIAFSKISPSCLRQVQVTVPKVFWSDVGGMEEAKRAVREAVELPLKRPDAFQRLGIRPPQGVLLYGPPGCSKTLLAKAVATESEMNFIAIKGPELLSKWVGDSEKAIQATFRRAKQSKPCVVFFDEIDALASDRTSTSSSVGNRVTSQLLQELDGVEPRSGVVVLCATNRPDLLDPALLRPGRIDRCVYVPPPDANARLEILKINLKKIPHDFDDELLGTINTHRFSGAEVAALCREAALRTLEADPDAQLVPFVEIDNAAKRVVPQITPEVLAFYDAFRAKTSSSGQLQ